MSTTDNTNTTTTPAGKPDKAPAAKKAAVMKTAAGNTSTVKETVTEPTAEVIEAVENFDIKSYLANSKDKLKESGEKFKESADKAQDLAKEVVAAQLGVYGKIQDEITSLIECSREKAPKQWKELVLRGKQVQSDLKKSQEELSSKIQQNPLVVKIKDSELANRLKDIDLKGEFKSYADKIKDRYQKSA